MRGRRREREGGRERRREREGGRGRRRERGRRKGREGGRERECVCVFVYNKVLTHNTHLHVHALACLYSVVH